MAPYNGANRAMRERTGCTITRRRSRGSRSRSTSRFDSKRSIKLVTDGVVNPV